MCLDHFIGSGLRGWIMPGSGLLALCCLPVLAAAQPYTPPDDYYEPAAGLTGEALKEALHDIISPHVSIDYYDKLPLLFSVVDQDPENPDHILLLYSSQSLAFSSSSWNREHSWPRSFGADEGPAFSDAHHLFPANGGTNSDRSNYAFANLDSGRPLRNAPESTVNDSLRRVEPRDADKGRIARAMFYMDTRYDAGNVTGDFILTNFPNSFSTRFGVLADLLEWNRRFPPDEREKRRNHLIYTGVRVGNSVVFQANRNPFVDYPDLVDAAFTADDYITWGSWRVEHFSFSDLDAGEITGIEHDPDGDTLPNFLEFAIQTDPRDPVNGDLPSVDRGETTHYFQFGRIPEPQHSFLSYVVEVSHEPLEASNWEAIPFTDRDLLIAPDGMAEFVSLPHAPGDAPRPAFYRLVLTRDAGDGDPKEFVYDPALEAAGGRHLFTYTEAFDNGWNRSDWFGYLQIQQAPWFYHLDHKWIFTSADDESGIWFYDLEIGWCYTSIDIYPYLHSSEAMEWLYFVEGSDSPHRWFYVPSASDYIREDALFNN